MRLNLIRSNELFGVGTMIRIPCITCASVEIPKYRKTDKRNGKIRHILSKKCVACKREDYRDYYEKHKNNEKRRKSQIKSSKNYHAKNKKKISEYKRLWRLKKADSVEWYKTTRSDGYSAMTHSSMVSY